MAFENCRSHGKLNNLFDQRASLGLLGMTPEDAAEEIKSRTGRGPSADTLRRLMNGTSVLPIYGLRETEIAWTFFTSSHIAEDAQLAELMLRVAKFADKEMLPFIISAENTFKDLRDRLTNLAPVRDPVSAAEHRLDQIAVESLSQQIKLYRAALAKNDKDREGLMVQARDAGLRALALDAHEVAEQAHRILLARAAINTLYPNYALDKMHGDDKLSRARQFANHYGTWSMFVAAIDCAIATRDPRLAHYFAELAILLQHRPYVFSRATNIRIERPATHAVETSARLLYMSKKLDGHEATPVNAWQPRWLEGRIPELDESQALVEQWEALGLTDNIIAGGL